MLFLVPTVLALAVPAPLLPPGGACIPSEAPLYFDPGEATSDPLEDGLFIRMANGVAREPELFKLIVVGHADTVGPAKLNLELSRRRADYAAMRLVAMGVPKDRIEVHAAGESGLAVLTPDNRAERRNRRVTVLAQEVVDLKKVFAGGDPSPPPLC